MAIVPEEPLGSRQRWTDVKPEASGLKPMAAEVAEVRGRGQ